MYPILLRLAASSTLAIAFLVLAGCSVPQTYDSWGDAYVAPATLNVRGELRQKNSTVAVLKHGDHVSVLDVHRRFVKVRTDKGVVGWLDSAELLSSEQMRQIRADRKKMLALPSEGKATVFEPLNMHIDPSRQSPAFAKVGEGESIAVLERKIEPKVTGPVVTAPLTFHRPEPEKKQKKAKPSKASFRLPPKPPPPKPPEDLFALSGRVSDQPKQDTSNSAKQPQKPPVMESWSLVRTKDNQVGWVLSHNLIMSIPDDVAQYAEGKQITSYFDLGAVQDEEKGVQHDWLWTTLSSAKPYDFDSWRVFIWNRHRHRYETSYRARDLEGYFPVHVDAQDTNSVGRTFELITKDDDGKMRRRTYQFDGVRVHLSGTEDYRPDEQAAQSAVKSPGNSSKPSSWLQREWNALKRKLPGQH